MLSPALRAKAVGISLVFLCLGVWVGTGRSQTLPVRVNRWLETRQLSGTVTYQNAQGVRPARQGNRLQAVGDAIRTFQRSKAMLAVDTGIGFVHIGEQTQVRVQQLRLLEDGGRVTRLQVKGGQARLKVRSFNRSGSRLEIETPAGWSGVRGTEFGVAVGPNGKTGLATREGHVVTNAQGQTVDVMGGFQSLIIPGEAPLPPEPLTDNPSLDIKILRRVGRRIRVAGQTEPVNLVLVDDVPRETNRFGEFDLQLFLPGQGRVRVVVITPLGKVQTYETVVP